ncbi:MAG TPA: ABC transporter ATP-binding protein [Pseudomonadales bacterium]|nr:ABC transporter ATP-binding protein [Pseudomonadales bacterium]
MADTQVEIRDYSMFDAELSGTAMNLTLLRRLIKWLQPYRRTFAFSVVLVLISSTLAVLLPVVMSIVIIDHIILQEADVQTLDLGTIETTEWLAQQSGLSMIAAACLLYGGLQLMWAVTGHLHRMTLVNSVINGLRDLRQDLFEHLETRPSSFFDRVAVGRIMTRVTNDIEALYELLRGLGTLIGEFVPFLVALIIMLAVDIKMTGILMLAIPIIALATYWFRQQTGSLFRLIRQSVSTMNQNLQENLAGLQVVQLSHREKYNHRRYDRINSENLKFESRSVKLETLYGALNDSMVSLAIGSILWFAGGDVIRNQISLGGMILFTRFIDMLFHPIVVLGQQFNVLFRAMASGERIFQALDWDEKVHEPLNPATLPKRLSGTVEFRNLDFEYDRGIPILQNLSFTIRAGEKLAIVGPTGSGKSTIVRLLGRFYDIDDHSIFLDGIDLNQIHSHDLRQRIGVVLQDFHIFSGTVYDNIALGDQRIEMARAVQAARTVNADRFIRELPLGYETPLSERGQNLSQGQRQLLAFARVLAADPEILILDEATASIDTETEVLIQEGLRELTRARTSILIAHRLQTIQQADRILVLDDGQVSELGTHEELVASGGLYSTLHSLQFQDTDDPPVN